MNEGVAGWSNELKGAANWPGLLSAAALLQVDPSPAHTESELGLVGASHRLIAHRPFAPRTLVGGLAR